MKYYCLKCKGKTSTINEHGAVSSNGRPMIKGNCAVCGRYKSTFVPIDFAVGSGLFDDIRRSLGKVQKGIDDVFLDNVVKTPGKYLSAIIPDKNVSNFVKQSTDAGPDLNVWLRKKIYGVGNTGHVYSTKV